MPRNPRKQTEPVEDEIRVINKLEVVENTSGAIALFGAILWGSRSQGVRDKREKRLCLFPDCEAPATTVSDYHPWALEGAPLEAKGVHDRFFTEFPWFRLRADACQQCAERAKATPGLPCYCDTHVKEFEPYIQHSQGLHEKRPQAKCPLCKKRRSKK